MVASDAIRQVVGEIAPRHDIARVYLFGFRARGEATESSDIDLCPETGPSFSRLSAEVFLSCIERRFGASVDVVTERSLSVCAKIDAERQDSAL
ncbi:MAG TPA: nucleotidyltransferase domain-containing protein [Candidatus Aveggerthella stercoripullorum]|uniref:Nucleotidyltransferase domain-containing protein n=1 Tax=Candidatus Aveggerthella stercoripullorum TaxID=2840688 RepID=A0A9D1A164_9ACTN|nr:nucleotidyltransferase domain-containing protein [Candidatus Aveggerthella stercoripullorum]